MKKILLCLITFCAISLNAQYYTFSKSTGTYTNLTGAAIIDNSDWDVVEYVMDMPFAFKYWGVPLTDSLYIDDYGTISLNNAYDGEISFIGDDLKSKGAGKSLISYKVEGSMPNRILKVEYRNAGLAADLQDSLHVQCWFYETTNVIEFHYGANKVKPATWVFNGATALLTNVTSTKYVILTNNPANPTVVQDINKGSPLNGMPVSGTVYKFTPSVTNGIEKVIVNINVIGNKISLPASVEVSSIKIYNVNGQLLQAVSSAKETDLSIIGHGLYVVVIETSNGLLTRKIVL